MSNIQQRKIHSQWRIQQDFNTYIPAATPTLWHPKNKTNHFSTPTKKHIEFDLSFLILLLFYLIKLFSTHFNFSLWFFQFVTKYESLWSIQIPTGQVTGIFRRYRMTNMLIYCSSKNQLNWLCMRLIGSIHHSAKVT